MGRLVRRHGLAVAIEHERAADMLVGSIRLLLRGRLIAADADGKERHTVAVLVTSRLELRFELLADWAPCGPELQHNGLLADELRKIDSLTVQRFDRRARCHRADSDTRRLRARNARRAKQRNRKGR